MATLTSATDEKHDDTVSTSMASIDASKEGIVTNNDINIKVEVDSDQGLVKVSYKNKMLIRDNETFIYNYLLSNIFKTNDKILSYISKNNYDLVTEMKDVLSIMYKIDIFDFNIIFEIPYNDFILDLDKCEKEEKIGFLLNKIKSLNNIISFNNLIINKYEININDDIFHNFTLKECINELKQIKLTNQNYSTSTFYYKYQNIMSYTSQYYTSSGSTSSMTIETNNYNQLETLISDHTDVIISEIPSSSSSTPIKIIFDILEDHKYYLHEYNNQIVFGINNYQGPYMPKKQINLYLHPKIYNQSTDSTGNYLFNMFTRDIIIGKIKKTFKNIYQSKRMCVINFRGGQLPRHIYHSNPSNANNYADFAFIYLPKIEKNIIKFEYITTAYSRSTSGNPSHIETFTKKPSIRVGTSSGRSSTTNIGNPIRISCSLNLSKNYCELNWKLPLQQIQFWKK